MRIICTVRGHRWKHTYEYNAEGREMEYNVCQRCNARTLIREGMVFPERAEP